VGETCAVVLSKLAVTATCLTASASGLEPARGRILVSALDVWNGNPFPFHVRFQELDGGLRVSGIKSTPFLSCSFACLVMSFVHVLCSISLMEGWLDE